MFTDTDSFVDETKTKNAYEEFYEDKNFFDFSDYPHNSKFFDPGNKKVTGKMKGKFRAIIIIEFVGVKPKVYSLVDVDDKESKKVNEVNESIVTGIRHKKFVNV